MTTETDRMPPWEDEKVQSSADWCGIHLQLSLQPGGAWYGYLSGDLGLRERGPKDVQFRHTTDDRHQAKAWCLEAARHVLAQRAVPGGPSLREGEAPPERSP